MCTKTIFVFLLLIGCLTACQNSLSDTKPASSTPVSEIALAVTPSVTSSPKIQGEKKAGLVELVKLDDSIKLDIRYATTNNFVGKMVYKEARAFLQRPAADALVRIHKNLKEQGFGLVIFDGYRPLSATKLFWEVTPASKKKYVADPKTGSRHNRGCAVDLSLFDLNTGANLDMPSDFDDFTEHAAIDYRGVTEQQKKNREILRNAMERDGYKVYPAEWWHYDFLACPESRILDVNFSDIGKEKGNG